MVDDPFADMPTVPGDTGVLPGEVELGAFSISLNVADLQASLEFYGKLGFVETAGSFEAGYLILKNGESTIGLFHGMFVRNILTFNPGLTNRMEKLQSFTDVRDIQRRLDDEGAELTGRVDQGTEGPGSITLVDPDGNPVLIDQFF